MDHSAHDFDSISPSAYALLMMKGLTPIPYAHEAARLLRSLAPSVSQSFGEHSDLLDPANRKPEFWARALHFESRYFGVDQLLSDLTATNILELSSGFSFRGLALSRRQPVFYIDTDLPDLIATKKRFVEVLTAPPAPGHYELHPLNALDSSAFEDIIRRFPPGNLTILNEGLLVYLDATEKERLCHNIRNALLQRDGCWITGDIYLRAPNGGNLFAEKNDAFREFLEQHHIEENKFSTFDEARAFFARMGFTVEREATVDFTTLSSLPRLLASVNPEQLDRLRSARARIHATWRLRPA